MCFTGVESPLLDAAQLGVLTMASVVVVVLGVFGAWFRRLSKLEQEATSHTPGLRTPPRT